MTTPQVREAPGDPAGALAAMVHLTRLSAARNQTRPLTEDEAEALADSRCAHCGGFHGRACPRVRRIEWHQNGVIASVEFWPASQVDWTGVVFDDEDGDQFPEEDLRQLLEWMRGRRPAEHVQLAVRRLNAWLEPAEVEAVQSGGA